MQIYQRVIWLIGCFGFNGFQSISGRLPKRGRKRTERIVESKNVQTTPTRTYCERSRPLPYCIQIVGRPGTGSLSSTIAPPDHPEISFVGKNELQEQRILCPTEYQQFSV